MTSENQVVAPPTSQQHVATLVAPIAVPTQLPFSPPTVFVTPTISQQPAIIPNQLDTGKTPNVDPIQTPVSFAPIVTGRESANVRASSNPPVAAIHQATNAFPQPSTQQPVPISGPPQMEANTIVANQQMIQMKQQQNELIRNCIKLLLLRTSPDPEKLERLKNAIRSVQHMKAVKQVRMPQDLFVLVEPIVGRDAIRSCLEKVKEDFRANRTISSANKGVGYRPQLTPEEALKLHEKACTEGEREVEAAFKDGFAAVLEEKPANALGASVLPDDDRANEYDQSMKRVWVDSSALPTVVDEMQRMMSSPMFVPSGHGMVAVTNAKAAAQPYLDTFGGRFLAAQDAANSLWSKEAEERLAESTLGPSEWFNAMNRTECAMRLK
jgi:hypothetical protein